MQDPFTGRDCQHLVKPGEECAICVESNRAGAEVTKPVDSAEERRVAAYVRKVLLLHGNATHQMSPEPLDFGILGPGNTGKFCSVVSCLSAALLAALKGEPLPEFEAVGKAGKRRFP